MSDAVYVQPPHVEDDLGELWLVWSESAMGGYVEEWKQRRLTRREVWLWRILRRVPTP